jgi:putative Holliday junction resolvase
VSRIVALDLGSVRIGIAASDEGGVLASPVAVVTRSGDAARDRALIAGHVRDLDAGRVLVGVPYSLDGGTGPAAQAALAEIDALAAELGVPVEPVDERFTTTTAHRVLRDAGRSGRQRRQTVDAAAAAVMLQAWLDGRRPQESDR